MALAGCGAAPQDSLGWTERWELIGLLEDGGVLDARASVGNTDLLRGEGHLFFDRWAVGQSPMLSGLDAPPPTVEIDDDHGGIRLQESALERQADGSWRLSLASEPIHATVTLSPIGAPVPPTPLLIGGGQWAEEALVAQGTLLGWVEAEPRGGLLRGRGVLLHRGGDGWPEGPRALTLLGCEGLSVGLDTQGEARFAWARWRGTDLDASAAQLSGDDNHLILDYRPSSDLWAELKLSALGEREGTPALMMLERPFSGWLRATASRQLWRALATVHIDGQSIRCNGMVLRER